MKKVGVPETPLEVGRVDVLGDRGPRRVRVRRSSLEAVDVEAELLGVADEVAVAERVLVLEQQVVHLPERALLGRRLRRLGRQLRVRVDVVQRQVPPHVADVAVLAQQLAHDRLGLAAVRALEVAVLDAP